MAKEKFTVEDLEQELRRRSREAKVSLQRPSPKKEYPNSDRYGEDGRRMYSAYDATPTERRPSPEKTVARQETTVKRPLGPAAWVKRVRLAAIALGLVVAVLFVIVMSALPH